MKTIELLIFPYYFTIPNGVMRFFSGAPGVICGVLGEIGVISLLNEGDVQLRRLGRLAQNEPSPAIHASRFVRLEP